MSSLRTGPVCQDGISGSVLAKRMKTWIAALFFFTSFPGTAGELAYNLQSPLVGGNNSSLYQVENARVSQKKQIKAQAEADIKQAAYEAQRLKDNSPTARFANALQSQLFMAISMKLSDTILTSKTAGSFAYGDLYVGYERVSGAIRVTINSPSGTTTLDLPD